MLVLESFVANRKGAKTERNARNLSASHTVAPLVQAIYSTPLPETRFVPCGTSTDWVAPRVSTELAHRISINNQGLTITMIDTVEMQTRRTRRSWTFHVHAGLFLCPNRMVENCVCFDCIHVRYLIPINSLSFDMPDPIVSRLYAIHRLKLIRDSARVGQCTRW